MTDLVPYKESTARDNVFGCAECGCFYDDAQDDRFCSRCGANAVIALGGAPNAEKAGALIAWARRDATELLEARGAVIGAVLAMVAGLAAVSAFAGFGAAALVVVIYGGIIGAVAGWLASVPAHRLLFPKSRMQPMVSAHGRRWLWISLGALILLPAIGLPVAAAMSGDRSLGQQMRIWLGQLLLWIST